MYVRVCVWGGAGWVCVGVLAALRRGILTHTCTHNFHASHTDKVLFPATICKLPAWLCAKAKGGWRQTADMCVCRQ